MARCQKKAHQSWPSSVNNNKTNIETHYAMRECNVQKHAKFQQASRWNYVLLREMFKQKYQGMRRLSWRGGATPLRCSL